MSTPLAEISKKIREKTGWTQQQLADRLLLSRNYIAQIESGAKEGTTRLLRDMQNLLRQQSEPITQSTSNLRLSEDAREYNAEPTAEDCIEYLRTYLSYSKNIKGLLGHTWVQLHKQFPLEEARKMEEARTFAEALLAKEHASKAKPR